MYLWHFTCAHSVEGIEATGQLEPTRQALPMPPVVWLSSAASPPRAALGLSSHMLACDRMAHRYRVEVVPGVTVPWSTYRATLPPEVVRVLEATHGTRPGLWWVSESPVPGVRQDP